MGGKITIKDIAVQAGVSPGTVDRVLHGRGNVSSKNLLAVKRALEDLSYIQDNIEQQISAVRSSRYKIGISHPIVEPRFWSDISIGIQKTLPTLNSFGIEIVEDTTPSHNIDAQLKSIDNLINEQHVNALLITPVNDNFSSHLVGHIPDSVPYATVIDDTIGTNRLFHIGPNNLALGSLAAKLIYLQKNRQPTNTVIFCPEMSISGTQERISGFINKTHTEEMPINIVSICSIAENSATDIEHRAENECRKLLEECPDVGAVYVTYGIGDYIANVVKKMLPPQQRPLIICHEFNAGIRRRIEDGSIYAALYQKPAQQWFTAIKLMTAYLTGNAHDIPKYIPADCNLLTKETLPLFCENYMEYLS